MVTERGAGLLIGAAFAWLLGRFLGVPELYVLAAAAVALVALAALALWLSATRLEVERSLSPARVAWGGTVRVRVVLRNAGRLGSGMLLVGDEVPYGLADGPRFALPGLAPRAEASLSYDLAGGARGRYRVGPARVRARDPFGLAERVRHVGGAGELVVYPRLERLAHGVPAAPRNGDGGRERRALLHAGDEFSTIREWAPGDDIRMVHWPSSAHRSRLMVRQFEQPWEPQATLVCDTRAAVHRGTGPSSTVETAITAVASVAELLTGYGHRLRLVLPDDDDATVQDRDALMDRLAEAEPSRRGDLARCLARASGRGAGGLLVAAIAPPAGVSDGRLHPDVTALLAAGRAFSVRIALVVDTAGPAARANAAADLAVVLQGGGWRTAVLRPGRPLADAWTRVAGAAALAAGGA